MYLRSSLSMQSFSFHSLHFEAAKGGPGGSNHKKGAKGYDSIITVPSGQCHNSFSFFA